MFKMPPITRKRMKEVNQDEGNLQISNTNSTLAKRTRKSIYDAADSNETIKSRLRSAQSSTDKENVLSSTKKRVDDEIESIAKKDRVGEIKSDLFADLSPAKRKLRRYSTLATPPSPEDNIVVTPKKQSRVSRNLSRNEYLDSSIEEMDGNTTIKDEVVEKFQEEVKCEDSSPIEKCKNNSRKDEVFDHAPSGLNNEKLEQKETLQPIEHRQEDNDELEESSNNSDDLESEENVNMSLILDIEEESESKENSLIEDQNSGEQNNTIKVVRSLNTSEENNCVDKALTESVEIETDGENEDKSEEDNEHSSNVYNEEIDKPEDVISIMSENTERVTCSEGEDLYVPSYQFAINTTKFIRSTPKNKAESPAQHRLSCDDSNEATSTTEGNKGKQIYYECRKIIEVETEEKEGKEIYCECSKKIEVEKDEQNSGVGINKSNHSNMCSGVKSNHSLSNEKPVEDGNKLKESIMEKNKHCVDNEERDANVDVNRDDEVSQENNANALINEICDAEELSTHQSDDMDNSYITSAQQYKDCSDQNLESEHERNEAVSDEKCIGNSVTESDNVAKHDGNVDYICNKSDNEGNEKSESKETELSEEQESYTCNQSKETEKDMEDVDILVDIVQVSGSGEEEEDDSDIECDKDEKKSKEDKIDLRERKVHQFIDLEVDEGEETDDEEEEEENSNIMEVMDVGKSEEKEANGLKKRRVYQFIDFEAEEGEETDVEEEEEDSFIDDEEEETEDLEEDTSLECPKKLVRKFIDDEAVDEDILKKSYKKKAARIESDEEYVPEEKTEKLDIEGKDSAQERSEEEKNSCLQFAEEEESEEHPKTVKESERSRTEIFIDEEFCKISATNTGSAIVVETTEEYYNTDVVSLNDTMRVVSSKEPGKKSSLSVCNSNNEHKNYGNVSESEDDSSSFEGDGIDLNKDMLENSEKMEMNLNNIPISCRSDEDYTNQVDELLLQKILDDYERGCQKQPSKTQIKGTSGENKYTKKSKTKSDGTSLKETKKENLPEEMSNNKFTLLVQNNKILEKKKAQNVSTTLASKSFKANKMADRNSESNLSKEVWDEKHRKVIHDKYEVVPGNKKKRRSGENSKKILSDSNDEKSTKLGTSKEEKKKNETEVELSRNNVSIVRHQEEMGSQKIKGQQELFKRGLKTPEYNIVKVNKRTNAKLKGIKKIAHNKVGRSMKRQNVKSWDVVANDVLSCGKWVVKEQVNEIKQKSADKINWTVIDQAHSTDGGWRVKNITGKIHQKEKIVKKKQNSSNSEVGGGKQNEVKVKNIPKSCEVNVKQLLNMKDNVTVTQHDQVYLQETNNKKFTKKKLDTKYSIPQTNSKTLCLETCTSYKIVVSGVPNFLQHCTIKQDLFNKLGDYIHKIDIPSNDFDGSLVGHVIVYALDEKSQEYINNLSDLKLWDSELKCFKEHDFNKKFLVQILGWHFPKRELEAKTELETCLKTFGVEKFIVVKNKKCVTLKCYRKSYVKTLLKKANISICGKNLQFKTFG